ncbi:helix-turn-helix domain-containing protein [Marinilongibacter aquaticus]|uniref:helix-turn-helix domain-containing protein n=1 Tax=Marinilongibacter aquaticus TaxID=2975157 RepID=UPI0021BDD1FE|nr:helix-turn-helix domain-containing protein [Marinilongibacter aquaticus]UBM59492.1 helix-turn-helix domain-containing protein [Marinilongibacter aquaticus]
MKTVVQQLREARNLTQTELAQKSGLSLRTIQRIEAGNIPKGYTLKALAQSLETEAEKLIPVEKQLKLDRAKLINLSSLMGLILPFGGVIFPLILTNKTNDKINKDLGKRIVSVQILIAALLSFSLILSPFIQKELAVDFPLFLIPLLATISLKIFVCVMNGISLNKNNDLHKIMKINYL